jgi:hypothetical protein
LVTTALLLVTPPATWSWLPDPLTAIAQSS